MEKQSSYNLIFPCGVTTEKFIRHATFVVFICFSTAMVSADTLYEFTTDGLRMSHSHIGKYRGSNRNSVAWNCTQLCGIAHNCSHIGWNRAKFQGNYRADHSKNPLALETLENIQNGFES